jgi:hypothetical protein
MKRTMSLILTAFGAAGWILFAARATQSILSYALGPARDSVWLYDWRVYYAGALDLVERDLYLDHGIGVRNLQMPVHVFNNPPMAAALPLPLLPFGYEVGGLIWVIAGAVALAASAVAAVRVLGIRVGWAWIGLFWLAYVAQPFFVRNMVLGNVNAFMLPIVVAFAWAHLKGHQRSAGLLLGLAISIKVWPVLIAILLLRERRWLEIVWAAVLVAVQGILVVLWLGPNVLPAMVDALRASVPIPAGVVVLWTTWARTSLEWWPAWGSIAVAGLLIAIPARGPLGLGLAMLAGLSLIANLWDHYLPTFVFVALLIATSPEAGRLAGWVSSPWAGRRSMEPASR